MRNLFRKSETLFNKQRQLNRTSEYSYDPHIRMLWEWSKFEKEVANNSSGEIREDALIRADNLLGEALYLCDLGISTVPKEEQNILSTLQGQLFAYMGDLEGARSNFSSILQKRPDHDISRYLWAKLEYENENYSKALELIEKAIGSEQKDPMFFRLKVHILEKQFEENKQDVKIIIETIEKALTVSREDLSLWFSYGYFTYIQNDFSKSNNAFAKTRDLCQGLIARFKVLKVLSDSYKGSVTYTFKNRGKIKVENIENEIYFNPLHPENDQNIKAKDRVSFKIGFNYLGPIALDVKKLI